MHRLQAFVALNPLSVGEHYPRALPSLVVALLGRLLVQLNKNEWKSNNKKLRKL